MNCIIFLFLIVNVLINEISTQDYCHLESCPNESHTKCRYNSAPAGACGDQAMIQTGLSTQQRDEIVNFHNDRRAFVASGKEQRGNPGPQPPATNMKSLMWDEEVASIAQTWADQCDFRHDECRNVERFGVGQNIVYSAASDQFRNNLTSLMLSWYEEVQNLDNRQVKEFGNNPAGHYTQMVWANSEFIGCGFINYQKDGWFATYLVCNYGPPGNFIGQPIYETP